MLSLLHKVPRLQGPGDEKKMSLGDLQVSSEDGALQAVPSGQDGGKAVWPSTLGEGDKEQVDASQGKDGVKVKSKQKKKRRTYRKSKGGKGLRRKVLGDRPRLRSWRRAAGTGGVHVATAGGRLRRGGAGLAGRRCMEAMGTREPRAAGKTRRRRRGERPRRAASLHRKGGRVGGEEAATRECRGRERHVGWRN